MNHTVETPPTIPVVRDFSDQNTPRLPNQEINTKSQNPIPDSGKNGAPPDRLMVPKAFKYPERYTSPTDKMMSPVSRGVLARSRKGAKLLPPSFNDQPQSQALELGECSPFSGIEKCAN